MTRTGRNYTDLLLAVHVNGEIYQRAVMVAVWFQMGEIPQNLRNHSINLQLLPLNVALRFYSFSVNNYV